MRILSLIALPFVTGVSASRMAGESAPPSSSNPIQAENALAGTDPTSWLATSAVVGVER